MPPDSAALLSHLMREGRLLVDDALALILAATDLFKREANVVRLEDPVTSMMIRLCVCYIF